MLLAGDMLQGAYYIHPRQLEQQRIIIYWHGTLLRSTHLTKSGFEGLRLQFICVYTAAIGHVQQAASVARLAPLSFFPACVIEVLIISCLPPISQLHERG